MILTKEEIIETMYLDEGEEIYVVTLDMKKGKTIFKTISAFAWMTYDMAKIYLDAAIDDLKTCKNAKIESRQMKKFPKQIVISYDHPENGRVESIYTIHKMKK